MCVFFFFYFVSRESENSVIFSIHFESVRENQFWSENVSERLTLASLSFVFSSLSRRSLFRASHELVIRQRERDEKRREERESLRHHDDHDDDYYDHDDDDDEKNGSFSMPRRSVFFFFEKQRRVVGRVVVVVVRER
jgi:hypothetical protein